MKDDYFKDLKALGDKDIEIPEEYTPDVLERFENPHSDRDFWVNLTTDEFTSICPRTGQPDFGIITINYIPDEFLVESKSLKLYFLSFRNYGIFHEVAVNTIADDLNELLNPGYLEVIGEFNIRGGIGITTAVQRYQEGWENFASDRRLNWE
jgi:7-cyano-7-deazaguanine reductase